MNEVEWTNEQVIKLVNEYKNKPELWDTNHNLYRVQTAKYEAWCHLAETFECDITDLKKKFNSIFASHRREKGKVRLGGRSTWFLYPHMSFLPSHVENDESVEVVQKPRGKKRHVEVSDQSSEENDTEMVEEIIVKEEPVNECYVKPQPKYKYVMDRPRLKRVLRRKLLKEPRQERLLDSVRMLKKSELLKKKDECDSFGEYIAVSLRKHDERTQSMIKQAINNILFEQEMKRYNTGQYTVMLAGVEENPLMDHEQEK